MGTATATAAEAHDIHDKKKKHPRDPAREVVETVVFVVVLVLLLKLFITEAFVIPTGSMAETLYGYQKIITCPKCGHEFPVNAHDEVENNPTTKRKHRLLGYNCPNCRYQGQVSDLRPEPDTRTGDRVLVLKPLYHLTRPRRGDVVVFKYPDAPQENHIAANYIKRAMGFGGETIAIHRGELFATTTLSYPEGDPQFPRPENPLDLWRLPFTYPNNPQALQLFEDSRRAGFPEKQGGFVIIRKGEQQVLADLRNVWDNDKQPKELFDKLGEKFQPRWKSEIEGRWTPDHPKLSRAFVHNGQSLDWVRYSHLVWQHDEASSRLVPWRWPDPSGKLPVAGPIDNMLGYNAGIEHDFPGRDNGQETLWVGDLILDCEAELGGGAEVVLELSRGVNRFQAKFANGQVTLTRTGPLGDQFGERTRPCPVNTGTHKIRFANVDARLMVWVNDRRIDFTRKEGGETIDDGEYPLVEPVQYEPDDKNSEGWTRANDINAPASIGGKGAVTIRSIKLHRDVYYTQGTKPPAFIYYVQPGHYLCLGDNSAQSSDSRTWGVVPDRLMLGKAVFVFWPAYPRPSRVGFIR